jgi:N-dimethylarginine dimethylaminohydrolase
MADVTAVGELAILTHAVAGHYDAGVAPQVQRSTLEGARFAADALLVPDAQRLFVELRYPHFHGDTVHFAARAEDGHRLLHYQGGLWGDGSRRISDRLKGSVVAIGERDAVDAYAANSRQIARTVLATEGVSPQFEAQLKTLGLDLVRLELAELFGKAGGGPGCATLYLPSNLDVPTDSPLRYSRMRELAHQRATRIPSRVTVAADFFDLRTKA